MIRNSGSNWSRMRERIFVLVCVLSAFLVVSGAVGLAWAEGDVSNGNGNVSQEMGQTEENANANEPGGSDKNAGTDSSQDENANSSANGGADSANDNSNESDSETSAQAKANAPMAEDEEGSGAATVNGTSYGTVQEAINVAKDGETVTVNRNFGEQLTITKNITLDLNGHMYTYTGSGKGISITDNHIVPTIKNGTVSGCTSQAICTSGAGVNLDNMAFSDNSGSSQVVSVIDYKAKSSLTWNNVTFTGNKLSGGLARIAYAANYKIENTSFTDNKFGNGKLLGLSGLGAAKLIHCTFENNSGSQIIVSGMTVDINRSDFQNNSDIQCVISARNITMNDTKVIGNSVTESTVRVESVNWDPNQGNIELKNSVIKNNTTSSTWSSDVAGLRADYDKGHTKLIDSAVYDNRRENGSGSDFSFWASNYSNVPDSYVTSDNLKNNAGIDITQMKDPTDSSKSFENYSITSSGDIVEVRPVFEAKIGEKQYKKFSDAWNEAKSGETITIINTDQGGNIADLTIGSLDTSGKDVTVDLNGHDLGMDKNIYSFNLTGTGKVQLVNNAKGKTSHINGWVQAGDNVDLSVGPNVELRSYLIPNGGNIKISGPHNNVLIFCWPSYSNGAANLNNAITFADSFSFTGNGSNDQSFSIDLANDDLKSALNDHVTDVSDFVIAKGLSEDDARKLQLVDVTNPLVTLVTSERATSVHKATGAIVYLDGDKGNDSNEGSSRDKAVYTFGRARQLVDEQLYPMSSPVKSVSNLLGQIFGGTPADADEPKRGYIIVCGTATISGVDGNATWCPSDSHPDVELTMLRDPDFGGPLVNVGEGKSLTLKDITLDGNRGNAHATSSLVSVSGGTLTIYNGAILCNNELTNHAYMQANGGAVHAESSTINVYGGKVNNNAACMGGGIYGSNSIINIDGGQISDNQAVNDANIQALGGGVMAWYGTKVNMTGGIVSNNHSDLHGGGIAIGCTYSVGSNKAHDSLAMTGGSVSDNVAEGSGGGIAIWSGTYDNYATASISGGSITGNKATSTRNGNYFAGGGVYVDGWGDGDKSTSGALLHDGELTLKNVLVTSNNAAWHGGGFAGCPTSSTAIDSSAAIVGNTADGGNDFYVRAGINNSGYDMNGSPSYSIAARMFNGSLYNWVDDSGNAVSADELSGQLTGDASLSLTSKAKVPSAPQNGVTISGNSSGTNGGGIGSNGTVTVEGTGKTYITIKKTWEGQNPPDNLTIHVELGGIKDSMRADLKPITLTRENGWSADVEIPEKASGFYVAKVRVQEDSPDGWDLSGISVAEDTGDDLEADDDDGWYTLNRDRDYADNDIRIGQTWTLSNVAVKPVSIDPPVKKVAKGDAGGEYPDFRYEMKPIGSKPEDGSDIALGDIPMPDGAEPDGDGVPSVVRTIAGADLKVGVTGSSDDTVATASTELGMITFTRPGTYRYQVRELNDSKKGWTYDGTVYTLEVNVTKDSDSHSLVAKEKSGIAIQKDATDNVMTFTNSYTKAEEPQNPGGGEPNDEPNTPAPRDEGTPKPNLPSASQGTSPEPTPAPASPIAALLAQTGDSNPVALTAGIAVAGAALVAAALWFRHRNRGNHYKR